VLPFQVAIAFELCSLSWKAQKREARQERRWLGSMTWRVSRRSASLNNNGSQMIPTKGTAKSSQGMWCGEVGEGEHPSGGINFPVQWLCVLRRLTTNINRRIVFKALTSGFLVSLELLHLKCHCQHTISFHAPAFKTWRSSCPAPYCYSRYHKLHS
jgi:hypothetical protein